MYSVKKVTNSEAVQVISKISAWHQQQQQQQQQHITSPTKKCFVKKLEKNLKAQ